MSDPRTAPYGSVRLADVDTLEQVDPGNPDINDCAFHLVRRHFDVQAFGGRSTCDAELEGRPNERRRVQTARKSASRRSGG